MDIGRAQGVIGGMYGDEGKGMMTCLLSKAMIERYGQCTVARYNSSAQAGHTVEHEGKRHVFHHLGSGSLVGANTYLGPKFVAHPMLFHAEADQLHKLGGNTQVFIDPRCLVSTPYDILINQAIEKQRGNGRHGSCGIGFGETIERSEKGNLILTVDDLRNPLRTREMLDTIRVDYLPKRLAALGLAPECVNPWRMDEGLLDRFMEDARFFLMRVQLADPEFLSNNTVFEGAQGLALDEELGHFPYVTRSKTGLPYLTQLCEEASVEQVDLHYGTRAYTTRHGAGPLMHEGRPTPPGFNDQTNLSNDYQGSIRLAHLDPALLATLVARDLERHQGGVHLRHGFWVSCLDQMGETTELSDLSLSTNLLPEYLREKMSGAWISQGWGADTQAWRLPDHA